MKRVAIEGVVDPVDVHTNKRLLDVLVTAGMPVLMACGGKGLCATCHVYVQAGAEQLSAKTPRETLALRMLADRRPSSRLACQAKVGGEGVVVSMPGGRYLTTGTKDLEALVGRRAEERILHPVDGRVLIEAGKIITRSRIRELSQVDVDLAEMRTKSLTLS
jgi:ferredoxin